MRNYIVITLLLLITLFMKGCMTPQIGNTTAPPPTSTNSETTITVMQENLTLTNIPLNNEQAYSLFLAIQHSDIQNLKAHYREDSSLLTTLFQQLIINRISTIIDDFTFLATHIYVSYDMLAHLHNHVIYPFLNNAMPYCHYPTQEAWEMKQLQQRQLITLSNHMISYNAYHRRCLFPIPLPQLTNPSPLYSLPTTNEREEEYYSDSEDEEAPHFNGIYNLTKYGVLSIEPECIAGHFIDKSDSVYDGFKSPTIINNYVSVDYRWTITAEKLQQDAIYIHKGLNDIQGFDPIHVTILCLALKQADGRIKKFLFTNQPSIHQIKFSNAKAKVFATTEILRSITQRAHELGYHVIMAQQAHAEAELMQFLQERPSRYTHIVSMGCSRSHCLVCSQMLTDLFRPGMTQEANISYLDSVMQYDQWLIPAALKYFLEKYQWDPSRNVPNLYQHSPNLKLKSNLSYSQDYEALHRKLSYEEWQQRPWRKSKHKVKSQRNIPS